MSNKNTGIIRAMKEIIKSSILQEDEVSLFNEIRILKELDHPNIIKIYELF